MDLNRSTVYRWIQDFSGPESKRRKFLEGKLREADLDPLEKIRGVTLIEVLLDEWDGLEA